MRRISKKPSRSFVNGSESALARLSKAAGEGSSSPSISRSKASGGGYGFLCSGFLCSGFALGSPRGSGFKADQRARTDLHRGRSPTLALHLVELVFRNTVQAAELPDRHCERVRVRAHRPPPVLRAIVLVCWLSPANFWARHRCTPFQTDGAKLRRRGFLSLCELRARNSRKRRKSGSAFAAAKRAQNCVAFL